MGRSVQNRVGGSQGAGAAGQQSSSVADDSSDSEEGIADLSRDICNTWTTIKTVVMDHSGNSADDVDGHDGRMADVAGYCGSTLLSSSSSASSTSSLITPGLANQQQSPDKVYRDVMQPLQFDSYGFLAENNSGGLDSGTGVGSRFTLAYHFENAVRAAGERSHPNRMKRLAQEAATLTTALPLSSSSSVFVRCDTDRLDIMKVLITGPADTPYANGCFEFDVYFPPDYPQSPMQVCALCARLRFASVNNLIVHTFVDPGPLGDNRAAHSPLQPEPVQRW